MTSSRCHVDVNDASLWKPVPKDFECGHQNKTQRRHRSFWNDSVVDIIIGCYRLQLPYHYTVNKKQFSTMMSSLSSSASLLARQAATKSHRLAKHNPIAASVRPLQRNSLATAAIHGSSQQQQQQQQSSRTAAALLLAAVSTLAVSVMANPPTASLEKMPSIEIVPATVKEKSTGIIFPQLCNAMSLVGCGVRIKWGFVKVR